MEDRKIPEDALHDAEGYLLALFTALIKAHKSRGKTGNITSFIKERLGDRAVASRVNTLLNELKNSIPKRTRLQREYEKAGRAEQVVNTASSSPITNKPTGPENPTNRKAGNTGGTANLAKAAEMQPEMAPRPFTAADAKVLDEIHKMGSKFSAGNVVKGLQGPELPKRKFRITEHDRERLAKISSTQIQTLPERDVVLLLRHLEDKSIFKKPVSVQYRNALCYRWAALLAANHVDEG